MPGYLVKTENFVAEIANDEELLRLAEVGTIQRGTRVRALPDKTWIEARDMPLLRRVWRDSVQLEIPEDEPSDLHEQQHLETVVDVAPHFAFDDSSSTDLDRVAKSAATDVDSEHETIELGGTSEEETAELHENPEHPTIELGGTSEEETAELHENPEHPTIELDGPSDHGPVDLCGSAEPESVDTAGESATDVRNTEKVSEISIEISGVEDIAALSHGPESGEAQDVTSAARSLDVTSAILEDDGEDVTQDFVRELHAARDRDDTAQDLDMMDGIVCEPPEEVSEKPAPLSTSEILDSLIEEHEYLSGELEHRDTSIVDMARVCRPTSSRGGDGVPAVLGERVDEGSQEARELEATKVVVMPSEDEETVTHNLRDRTAASDVSQGAVFLDASRMAIPAATLLALPNVSRAVPAAPRDARLDAITSDHEVVPEKPGERITREVVPTSRTAGNRDAVRKTASLVGGVEAEHREALRDSLHARKKDAVDEVDDGAYEENPSDVFRFRSRKELLKTLAREGEREGGAVEDEDISMSERLRVRSSREVRQLFADEAKDEEPSESGRLRVRNGQEVRRMFDGDGEEDGTDASRLKIRGRSELRHLLALEEKAARDKSPIATTLSTVDYSQPTSSELRDLFEREDELHLLIDPEKPEPAAKKPQNEPETVVEGPFSSVAECVAAPPSDPITAALPLRVDSVTHASKQARPEITKRTKAPTAPQADGPQTSTGFSHAFFDRALHDDEDPVACYDPLYLTNQRLWLIHFRADEVVDYESYDVENIHAVGLHEERRWALTLLDTVFIVAMAVLWIILERDVLPISNDVFFLSLMGLGIVLLPIFYRFSFCTTVQFAYAGNIIRTTVGLQHHKRGGIMEFLARLDNVRHARRRANGAKP